MGKQCKLQWRWISVCPPDLLLNASGSSAAVTRLHIRPELQAQNHETAAMLILTFSMLVQMQMLRQQIQQQVVCGAMLPGMET